MSGDYSQDRFLSRKSYGGVRQQQGRVGLDADWNEAWDIQDRRWRAETLDLMGACAVSPETPEAFKIELSADGKSFTIRPGRLYVDGLLAESFGSGPETFDPVLAEAHSSQPVLYDDQPYLPDAPPLDAPGRYLVYLDVWEREVTWVEAPDLLEPALRGVDTTTRLQTLWQVRALRLDEGSAGCKANFDEVAPAANGRLSVSFDDSLVANDPCVLPPTGGYRGTENHLYRIQIHDAGSLSKVAEDSEGTGATFKWSRDNASTVVPVLSISGRKVSLKSLGRDRPTRIKVDDWVEILDDHRELHEESGDLARVVAVDEGSQEITLDRDIPIADTREFASDEQSHADRHTRLCRWDQTEGLLSGGAICVLAEPIHLENGVKVVFGTSDGQDESAFRIGDYWLFAARPGNAEFGMLEQAPPRGIHHHYCRLAVIEVAEDQVQVIQDCRPRKVSSRASCCVVTVGDGIVSHGDFTDDIQAAIDAVSEGGKVCVLEGTFGVSASIKLHKKNVSLVGCGGQTRIQKSSMASFGFPLISVQADDVLVRDLFLSVASSLVPAAALSAEHSTGLKIVGCSMRSRSGAPAISLSTCADVDISDCEIQGYPALLASQCAGVRLDSNRVSDGGLWIGTGSNSITITRNRIANGQGPGILLGDAGELVNLPPVSHSFFIVRQSDTDFQQSKHRVQFRARDELTLNMLDYVVEVSQPGISEKVQIKDNTIDGMAGSGIATAYQKEFKELGDIAELDAVEDLEIVGNRIENCVQAKPDCRFPDGSGIGAGVLLTGCSNVRLRQNYVANNGCGAGSSGEQWPACGIVVGDCADVDISDNHCVDNGRTSEVETEQGKYFQAELAVLYVRSTESSRDALRVYNNVVRCKAGQAIIALSTGNVSISGNTFESLRYREQPLLMRDSVLDKLPVLQDFLEIITRFSCVLLLQYSGEPESIFSLPSQMIVSGNRIVCYHGSVDFAGAMHMHSLIPQDANEKFENAFCGASIGILSSGDVSFANNQAWYSQPSGAL